MKQTLFAVTMLCMMHFGTAQRSNISLEGASGYFQFSQGITNWSDPLDVTIITEDMEEKNEPGVPFRVRIKVVKRMVLACHYEVEITNLSDYQTADIVFYNQYTSMNGNLILHKLKLKPGATGSDKIIFAENGFKPKTEDDCVSCSWEMEFGKMKVSGKK